MTGEGSSKRKNKKRGKSLTIRKYFRLPGSSGDDNGGKLISASDDNLVYCDDTGNGVSGDSYAKTNSSSSRGGRVSSLFKAVLFDTALKKRMPSKKGSETTAELMTEPTTESTNKSMTESTTELTSKSTCKSPPLDEKTNNNSFNENTHNVVKVPEAHDNKSSNDSSNVVPLSPKTDATLIASSTVDTNSQKLTEKKVMTRVNSSKKKPPLPRSSSAKRVPKQDSEPSTINNSTSRLFLFIVLVVMVSLFLWMSSTTIETKSADISPSQLTNVVVENEL